MYQLAHRGLSEYYPENTMPAFIHALELPFDGIETDVQMTKDGELILLHDDTIDRTSDGKGYVADYTYEELLTFNFNNGKSTNAKIPKLEELLALMSQTDRILNIEIKREASAGTEEKVIELVRKYHMEKQVYYSSTDVNQMLRIRNMVPDAYVALIILKHYEEGLATATENHLNGVHTRFRYLTDERIEALKQSDICIGAWTITAQKVFARMKAQNILFAFTNRYFY